MENGEPLFYIGFSGHMAAVRLLPVSQSNAVTPPPPGVLILMIKHINHRIIIRLNDRPVPRCGDISQTPDNKVPAKRNQSFVEGR